MDHHSLQAEQEESIHQSVQGQALEQPSNSNASVRNGSLDEQADEYGSSCCSSSSGSSSESDSGDNEAEEHEEMPKLHSQHGRVGVVRLLLQQPGIHHSLEVKTADARARPLHMAVTWGHTEVVRLLLEAGADATKRAGSDLNTPLHLSALNGFAEIVQLLLQQPGVVEAAWKMNWPGFSALELAVLEGHEQVVHDLLSLLTPASLADDDSILAAVNDAASYAVEHKRQALLPPLLQLLVPDYADAAWFQFTRRFNFEKQAVEAVVQAWRLSLAVQPVQQEQQQELLLL
uniref:Uncharacterized protein n=1 Tax=Tetradesmus obliquus TaxID=3088 RepID=A0A383VVW6_TETOB|eukprot:jgi/Sobl393_1/6034/SZX69628.1